MLETNFISAVPLNLTFRSAFFVYQHIRRSLNDCGSRQSILKFRTALESPFHFQCNTATHRLQLSVISRESLLLFLIGFSYFCVCILCHFKANVNPFFDFFQIIWQTAPWRRRFLLPWASGWIILGAKGRIFTGRAEHAADLSSHPQFQVHPGHGDPGH